jgi:hypothetical protein
MPAAISTSSMMPFSGSIKMARLLIGGLGGTTFSRVPELASLAVFLRTQGLEEDEDLIRSMQEHFGLGPPRNLDASTLRGGHTGR